MHKYTVVSNEKLTPTTILLTLSKSRSDHVFPFEPGQYAAINYYKNSRPSVARCFSIVSSPTEPDKLQFSMRSGGKFTRSLSNVTAGQHIDVRGPFGGFVFDWESHKQAVLLAGGIGINAFHKHYSLCYTDRCPK